MVKSVVNCLTPEHTVMALSGHFNRNTAPGLRKDFLRLAREKGSSRIEIDLSNAVCSDTAGIAVMVEFVRVVRKQGGQLSFSGIDENTARMISLSRLDEIFKNMIVPEKK